MLDTKELIIFKEHLLFDLIEIQTIAQLFFEKGIITQKEYDVPNSFIGV